MHDVIYRVVMLDRKTGRWAHCPECATYDDAELAARGLVEDGKAVECQILEVGSAGGRIAAKVGVQPSAGFPRGQVVVKRQGDIKRRSTTRH
jgi:hypothetical protein